MSQKLSSILIKTCVSFSVALNTTQKPGESGIKVKDMYVFVSGGYACGGWEIVQVKPVFHFNRIVAKCNVFHCFVNTQVELMTWTQ